MNYQIIPFIFPQIISQNYENHIINILNKFADITFLIINVNDHGILRKFIDISELKEIYYFYEFHYSNELQRLKYRNNCQYAELLRNYKEIKDLKKKFQPELIDSKNKSPINTNEISQNNEFYCNKCIELKANLILFNEQNNKDKEKNDNKSIYNDEEKKIASFNKEENINIKNLQKEIEDLKEIKNYENLIKDQEINKLNHIIKKLKEENSSLSESIKHNNNNDEIKIQTLNNKINDYIQQIDSFNEKALKLQNKKKDYKQKYNDLLKSNNNLKENKIKYNENKQDKIEENDKIILKENFKKIMDLKNCRNNIINDQNEKIIELKNSILEKDLEITIYEERNEKLEKRIRELKI